ncbi:MAG: radical SAM protein [Ruminococcaceae bacterium]|nr:radical SAM protein [Oscillospiraceae bacterium]
MAKHKNLSIFVPHQGCPNQCAFCDQRSISGTQNPPSVKDVEKLCDAYLPQQNGEDYEIAFFGGSFTAIDRDYMESLLKAACSFVKRGRAMGIRISTRPDCIDQKVLGVLKEYGVTSIELGAQAMQDSVLCDNLRGHTVQAVVKASRLIKHNGFSLGLQMMTGMYGQQQNYMAMALDTAQQFVALKPDTVRIYPTVTLKNTFLEQVFLQGKYTPPTLEETVDICVKLMDIFEKADIRIIKMGLHADTGLEGKIVAGPYHQAFRELCLSGRCLEKIKEQLTNAKGKSFIIKVSSKELSQWKGQRNSNIHTLAALGYTVQIVADSSVAKGQFNIQSTD